MNLKYAELNRCGLELPVNVQERGRVVAAGVALALAHKLPLPSSQDSSPQEYFNFQVAPLVNSPLSDINESTVCDAKTALEFVRHFWMLRYATLYSTSQLTFAEQSPYGFFDTIMGCALHIPPKEHEWVNLNKNAIYKVALLTSQLLCEEGQTQLEASHAE